MNKIPCPVADCQQLCGARSGGLVKHINNAHIGLSNAEFAELCGSAPHNLIRCQICHWSSSSSEVLRRHKCVANAEAEVEEEDGVNDVANNNSNNNAEVQHGDMHEGNLDIDEGIYAVIGDDVGGVGSMKQPALGHLDPTALCQFDAVVVKLLKLAVDAEDEEGHALVYRALAAFA